MNYLDKVETIESSLVEDLQKLISINSVLTEFNPENEFPFGKGIQDALLYMLELGEREGFKTFNLDNYAGYIEFGEGDEEIGVLCHLDIVPIGRDWTKDPLGGEVIDGKIYGRGSNDDKGPTMAAFYAMKLLKDSGFKPNKRIRMILGTDEETGWRGLNYYLKHEKMPTIGFAPDAEFPLIYGEKGIHMFNAVGKDTEVEYFNSGARYNMVPDNAECRLGIDLEKEFLAYIKEYNIEGTFENGKYKVIGKSAHAMDPTKGVNACTLLCEFLDQHIESEFVKTALLFDKDGTKLGINYEDEEMGLLTMNLGFAKLQDGEYTIGVNNRVPQGWDMFDKQEKLVNEVSTYVNVEYIPVHYVSKEDELVKTLMESYVKYTNDTVNQPITIGGGTYARALDKAVAFGPLMPGREEVAHQKDEYMFLDDLFKATAIYADALHNLAK